jgi:hypothetical protein
MQVLSSEIDPKINFQTRLNLQALCEDLSLGRINRHAFCSRVVELVALNIPIENFETQLKKLFSVRTPVLDVIKSLPASYQIWLILDIPQEWYQSLEDRFSLRIFFPEDRLIFTTSAHAHRLDPDIFYYISRIANQPIDACVIVDGHSSRAVHAVRHGLSSTIFVDTRRLIRDFTLRGMLPK